MLDAALRLDSATILAIYKSGFTRIPVYQGSMPVSMVFGGDVDVFGGGFSCSSKQTCKHKHIITVASTLCVDR